MCSSKVTHVGAASLETKILYLLATADIVCLHSKLIGNSKNEACKDYMKRILQRTLNLQMSIFPHVQINVLLIMKQGLQEKIN